MEMLTELVVRDSNPCVCVSVCVCVCMCMCVCMCLYKDIATGVVKQVVNPPFHYSGELADLALYLLN